MSKIKNYLKSLAPQGIKAYWKFNAWVIVAVIILNLFGFFISCSMFAFISWGVIAYQLIVITGWLINECDKLNEKYKCSK